MQRFQARLKFESFVNSEECKTGKKKGIIYEGFESFVNSEECKTVPQKSLYWLTFESFVNSEECKTNRIEQTNNYQFESFVNSEECKTRVAYPSVKKSLRALLIQKSVKLLMRSKS